MRKLTLRFKQSEKEVGTDELGYIADIIRGYEITDKTIKEGIPNERASYELLCIGKLLHGEYCISSGFYNTFNYDANIYSVDMDTIRQKPEVGRSSCSTITFRRDKCRYCTKSLSISQALPHSHIPEALLLILCVHTQKRK